MTMKTINHLTKSLADLYLFQKKKKNGELKHQTKYLNRIEIFAYGNEKVKEVN